MGRDVVEFTELFKLLLDADVCKDELLDLFVIVVVLLVDDAGIAAAAKFDTGIDIVCPCMVEEIDVFGGAACPTFFSVR